MFCAVVLVSYVDGHAALRGGHGAGQSVYVQCVLARLEFACRDSDKERNVVLAVVHLDGDGRSLIGGDVSSSVLLVLFVYVLL